jgi:hypothetical protein
MRILSGKFPEERTAGEHYVVDPCDCQQETHDARGRGELTEVGESRVSEVDPLAVKHLRG